MPGPLSSASAIGARPACAGSGRSAAMTKCGSSRALRSAVSANLRTNGLAVDTCLQRMRRGLRRQFEAPASLLAGENITVEAGLLQHALACGIEQFDLRDLCARAAAIACVEAEPAVTVLQRPVQYRSEEHTSELQSLMRNSYAVFCL